IGGVQLVEHKLITFEFLFLRRGDGLLDKHTLIAIELATTAFSTGLSVKIPHYALDLLDAVAAVGDDVVITPVIPLKVELVHLLAIAGAHLLARLDELLR